MPSLFRIYQLTSHDLCLLRHQYLKRKDNFKVTFLSSADFFSKSTFSKYSFRNTIRVSNSLNSDQARQFFGPELGPNCLQRLSADDSQQNNSLPTGKIFPAFMSSADFFQNILFRKILSGIQ